MEAEDALAEFDNALRADALQREEQARQAAEALAKQQRLLEEKEAERVASERAKRKIYEELAKVYGGDAGSAIHIHVSVYFPLTVFTHPLPILQPCKGCQVSGDTC